MTNSVKKLSCSCLMGFSAVAGTFIATAQAEDATFFTAPGFSLEDAFHGGRNELSLNTGVMFSPFISTAHRPTVDYVFGAVQYGFMLNDVAGSGPLRGNFELAPEAFGAGIYENTGHYIAGGTLYLRYNFVPRASRIVPYFQVGGGWTFMDIDHRYDGKNFNFNVDGSAGLRYFIKPRVSLNLEYRFQHISNANLWEHNIGLNSQGPVLGISWLL